jgi:hypothetical protein
MNVSTLGDAGTVERIRRQRIAFQDQHALEMIGEHACRRQPSHPGPDHHRLLSDDIRHRSPPSVMVRAVQRVYGVRQDIICLPGSQRSVVVRVHGCEVSLKPPCGIASAGGIQPSLCRNKWTDAYMVDRPGLSDGRHNTCGTEECTGCRSAVDDRWLAIAA